MTTPRARGATLHLLDLQPVLDNATPLIRGLEDDSRLLVKLGHEPYAAVDYGHVIAVVCGEGVGWLVTEGTPLDLSLYVTQPGTIALLPRYSVTCDIDEVRSFITHHEVDLADHIRTFGARLEENFWAWYGRLHQFATAV